MIRYTRIRSWKYRVLEDVVVLLPSEELVGGNARRIPWPSVRYEDGLLNVVDLRQKGARLTVAGDTSRGLGRGYCWDGTSGPTIDTENSMRASCVHDALYQLMRAGKLGLGLRPAADKIFHDLLLEDGMNRIRAGYYFRAVRWFARGAALPPLPA